PSEKECELSAVQHGTPLHKVANVRSKKRPLSSSGCIVGAERVPPAPTTKRQLYRPASESFSQRWATAPHRIRSSTNVTIIVTSVDRRQVVIGQRTSTCS